VQATIRKVLESGRGMPAKQAKQLAQALSSGQWTHDYPITVDEARELGLTISTEMPEEVYKLMSLYPQTSQRRPSVEYIPSPYVPQPAGERKQS